LYLHHIFENFVTFLKLCGELHLSVTSGGNNNNNNNNNNNKWLTNADLFAETEGF
jgi:hypothetical protein